MRWWPEWLPVVRYDGSYLFVVCGVPRTSHSAVHRWDDVPDDPYTVQAPVLGRRGDRVRRAVGGRPLYVLD
ncbi:hypothetical protein M1L60_32285 [Actinoplanes sp. TRM 88003]|uniref:Uncharacterized protein n=1 Tax=Paractinoplanes aksuensis TaxID=2939490 RepID=A0ABT1DZ07_9ACTN|nr:hypothetical protein [Actinoplanes aksuensis]MCO8275271.1 hypothetical protein [Actinoplanes aksuensis]